MQPLTFVKSGFSHFGRFLIMTAVLFAMLFPLLSITHLFKEFQLAGHQLGRRWSPPVSYTDAPKLPANLIGQGVVTITFDDGWESVYQNALQTMEDQGIDSTQYIQSGVFNYPDYMSVEQVMDFQRGGHEIAGHTATHQDLTKLSPGQLYEEVVVSQQSLQNDFGPIRDFASPFGAYNDTTLALIRQHYRSHRTTEPGLNYWDGLDVYRLKAYSVTPKTSNAELRSWLKQAKDEHAWLILVYHQLDDSHAPYSANPKELADQLTLIKASRLPVATVDQVMQAWQVSQTKK